MQTLHTMNRSLQATGMPLKSQVTMSGLLNLMDGVGSDDHRIIFATVSSPYCLVVARLTSRHRQTTTSGWTLHWSGRAV
jgi:hypothetical protein